MNKKVLITGAGGPAAINVFKSLHLAEYDIHMADASDFACGLYMVAQEKRHILPYATDPMYCESLIQICLENQIDIIIPTVDDEFLAICEDRFAFAKQNIKVLMSNCTSLQQTLDKFELLNEAKKVVAVGAYTLLHKAKAEEFSSKKLVVKPKSGSGSRGIEFYNSFHEIPQDRFQNQDLLLQERFEGKEYSVDMVMDIHSNVKAAVARVRLKTDSGVSVTGKVEPNDAVIKYATKVVQQLGLSYAANVQIIDTKGGPRLVEINPRFSGGLCLTIRAGADTPKMALDILLGKHVEPITKIEKISMVRYFEEVYTTDI